MEITGVCKRLDSSSKTKQRLFVFAEVNCVCRHRPPSSFGLVVTLPKTLVQCRDQNRGYVCLGLMDSAELSFYSNLHV